MIKKILSDIRWTIFPLPYRKYLCHKDPRRLIQRLFRKYFNREIDFDNPTTYNEIINVQKIDCDNSLWVKLADKHRVREYIAERGLESILIESYGAWERPHQINFDALPNSFIIKTNNGAGSIIKVEDKSQLNRLKSRLRLKWWLGKKYGYSSAELHYAKIKPLVIIERLLCPSEYDLSISESIIDYKWFCFNGEVKYVEVITDRWNPPAHIYLYDKEWVNHPEYIRSKTKCKDIPRPKCLDEMIDICRRLSVGLPQVRVDLYEVDGKVYFGELTFSTGAGFSRTKTEEFETMLADEFFANLTNNPLLEGSGVIKGR